MKKYLLFLTVGIQMLFLNGIVNAVTCENYYYGIGVKQDYKKAFECFESEGEDGYLYLMMMYLNGDGVVASHRRHKKYMKRQAKQVHMSWLKK